jgi:hypothetical protein
MPEFDCNVCGTRLSVDRSLAGQLVRCPTCRTVQRAPTRLGESATPVTVGAPPPRTAAAGGGTARSPGTIWGDLPAPSGRRYGFACPYCSSPLEATDSMAAHPGQCPTCGNTINIPILDRHNMLIDPVTMQIIKQDPHPVHAYAAAGHRAPRIVRTNAGGQQIQCPRCGMSCPITADNCSSCGMPFTMEGTTVELSGASNGYCVGALVLGILSLPLFWLLIPAAIAVILGTIGIRQTAEGAAAGPRRGRGMAIAGLVLGSISFLGTILHYLRI